MHDIKIQVLSSNTESKLTKIYYSKKLETWKHSQNNESTRETKGEIKY
jgi:hypothetical protein